MNQRVVKPVFWPVLIAACVALSVMTFFLIGGMISSRMEDYFISALVGFMLFLVARAVQKNGDDEEKPVMAVGIMFSLVALGILLVWVMNHNLTTTDHVDFAAFEGHRLHGDVAYLERGVWHIGQYREWFSYLSNAGFNLTGRLYISLHRALYLSIGIIAGVLFVGLQVATCILLFVGTKPKEKEFRH